MATTKLSSRTKKPVRAASKRTTKRKSNSKAAPSKRVELQSASHLAVQTFAPKKWFYLLASLVSFGLIFVLMKFVPADPVDISISFLTRDVLLSRANDQFLSLGSSVLWSLDLRWVISLGLTISGAMSLYWLKTKHAEALASGSGTLHGTYIGVMMSAALLPAAMMSGIRDLNMLLFMLGSIVIASGIWSYLEKAHGSGMQVSKHLFLLMSFAMLLPVAVIKLSLLGTVAFGLVFLPWQVYVSYSLIVLALAGLLLSIFAQFKRYGLLEAPGFAERLLVGLSLALLAASVLLVKFL